MRKKQILICAFLCLLPALAHAEITDIRPDQNIGVYRQSEEVSFQLTRDTADTETVSYMLEDMDGTVRYSGQNTLSGENAVLKTGILKSGWYRLRIYENGAEIPIFASATVLPSTGTPAENSPFSGMLVGQYGVSAERKADFSEALHKVGVNRVRDAALWCRGEYDYQALEKNISALADGGNEQLLTVDLQSQIAEEIGYNGNLFEVYQMYRNLAARFSDEVSAWEVINEPDINSAFSADIYSAYYKAAALGIENAGSDKIKSFGGMCSPIHTFSDILMQNDVMTYADYYNAHTHRDTSGNGYDALGGNILSRSKRMSAFYGGNQPIWVTESGLRMQVDENELPSAEILREQAIYLTTSFAESIGKYGMNNHFWFLMRHYIEEGREFGTASKNCMTYPGYLAFANLSYRLGEAKPIGELSARGDVVGYFFDTGDGDAAILWKKTDGESYVQLSCENVVEVTDVFGATEVKRATPKNGLVNLKVTSDPLIIRFNGKCDPKNYCKKTFPEAQVRNRTNGQRVVLQQIWDRENFEDGARVLKAGETYTVTCRVYNFNPSARASGNLTVSANDEIEIVSAPEKANFVLSKYTDEEPKYKDFTYQIKVSEQAENLSEGSIMFSGTVGSETLSPSVSGYVVERDLTVSDDQIREFSGAYNRSEWNCGNRTAGSTCSVSSTGSSISFSLTFRGGNRCLYPYFYTSVPQDSEGIVFDRTIAEIGDGGVTQIFACTEDGMYLACAGEFSVGTVRYVLPWNKFKAWGGAETPLDPSKIYMLQLGINTYGDHPGSYTISHFGTFGNGYQPEEDALTISGIENGKTYVKGNLPAITAQANAEVIEIYVNFEKIGEVSPGEKIDLSGLDSGAVSLIAAIRDEFGKVQYKEVDFCIRNYNDYRNLSATYH